VSNSDDKMVEFITLPASPDESLLVAMALPIWTSDPLSAHCHMSFKWRPVEKWHPLIYVDYYYQDQKGRWFEKNRFDIITDMTLAYSIKFLTTKTLNTRTWCGPEVVPSESQIRAEI